MSISKIILTVFIFLILTVFISRLILPSQLDDLSPGIPCDKSLIEKSDILYIIPDFQNKFVISNNTKWCKEIASYNRELAMHGVYHEYKEFKTPRDKEYVKKGKTIFQDCFGFTPKKFKPPQLAWTNKNNWMKKDFEVDLLWNQVFHKVYHCEDNGFFPNWLINLF